MRTEDDILSLLLSTATEDNRVLASELSKNLELDYNPEEADNVMEYLELVRRTNSNTPDAP